MTGINSVLALMCGVGCALQAVAEEASVTNLASDERIVFITTDARLSDDGRALDGTWLKRRPSGVAEVPFAARLDDGVRREAPSVAVDGRWRVTFASGGQDAVGLFEHLAHSLGARACPLHHATLPISICSPAALALSRARRSRCHAFPIGVRARTQ